MESKTPANVEAPASEYTRRVLFECNATRSELSNGKVVRVGEPSKVFTPTRDPSLSEEELAAFDARDFSKAIVTNITLRSVSSNCDEPVTVGLNLFENGVQLTNDQGWLYAQPPNDMSDAHTNISDNYMNLTTVLPHERQRPNEVIYTPSVDADRASQITKYGHLTASNLWDNIVAFPNEPYYYVDADHVVCKVVSQNWDRLGIAPEHEQVREGKWVKLSKDVVNNCIEQLQESVIRKMPLTALSDLGARFTANVSEPGNYKVVAEMCIKYKFP